MKFVRSILAATLVSALTISAGPPPQPAVSGNPNKALKHQASAAFLEALILKDLTEIANAISRGQVSSQSVVTAYIERIGKLDRSGPHLNAVLALNPNAIEDARHADAVLSKGKSLGPLHGVPILLKDNIESKDPLATTAGSFALKDNVTGRDAAVVAFLRSAGAIILGKTNLSQWANYRSSSSVGGWSALGGVVRNPHMLNRSACGSSSGSAVAVSAALAAAALGTETNGSIICPASTNGIVGLKPTVGLVDQSGIVPISFSQDTAGPMTRSVRDAALLLTVMAGKGDSVDYTAHLDKDYFSGKRIGVLKFAIGPNPDVSQMFKSSLSVLESLGAQLVPIETYQRPLEQYRRASSVVLQTEFKHTINAYLKTTDPSRVSTRTLADLIQFNETTQEESMTLFDQALFIQAQAAPGIDDPAYLNARELARYVTQDQGIDKFLAEHDVDLLVSPSRGPAYIIDVVYGDQAPGGIGAGYMAAVAGYPNLTVPMGMTHGLPIGIDFMSGHGRDGDVLAAGYAYEQATKSFTAPNFSKNEWSIEEIAEAMATKIAQP